MTTVATVKKIKHRFKPYFAHRDGVEASLINTKRENLNNRLNTT